MAGWFFFFARSRAVWSQLCFSALSAPAFRSASTTWILPHIAAKWRAVQPSLSTASTVAPAWSSRFAMEGSPPLAAKWRG